VTFVDMESGSRVVAHTERLRVAYRRAMDAQIAGLRELSNRRQVRYTPARTDSHFFDLFDRLAQ